MSTSTRLRGNGGLHLTFANGTTPAVSYGDDVKSWELTPEDKDDSDLTFAEAAEGATKEWTLSVTGIVSFDANSLWMYLSANPGATLATVLGPKGNIAPAVGKPHWEFDIEVGGKPGFGNTARTSQEGQEFTHEMKVVGDIGEPITGA